MVDGLHKSGMTFDEIKKYLQIWEQISDISGQSSTLTQAASECIALLQTKKRQLWQQLEDIQAGIDFLERQEEILQQNSSIIKA